MRPPKEIIEMAKNRLEYHLDEYFKKEDVDFDREQALKAIERYKNTKKRYFADTKEKNAITEWLNSIEPKIESI